MELIMEIRQLPKSFTGVGEVRGVKFRQIKETNNGFIYERTQYSGVCYEVFRKRINKRFGNISYPKSKSFGKWAWCCSTLDKAEEYLKSFEV